MSHYTKRWGFPLRISSVNVTLKYQRIVENAGFFSVSFSVESIRQEKKKSENNLKKRKKNTTVFWTSNNDNLKDILLKQSDIWKSRYTASSWNYWSLYYHRSCFKKEKNEKVIESISVFVTLSTYTTSRHKYLKSCTHEDR